MSNKVLLGTYRKNKNDPTLYMDKDIPYCMTLMNEKALKDERRIYIYRVVLNPKDTNSMSMITWIDKRIKQLKVLKTIGAI